MMGRHYVTRWNASLCILAREGAKARWRQSVPNIEELARLAVECGLQIHRDLGPGLLESVYETVLADALKRAGADVRRQVPLPICYQGITLNEGFRIDLLIGDRLIIEVKSVEILKPVHAKQLLTYLRLSKQPLGLLMNFGAVTFREGIRRVVNGHTDIASSRLRVHQGSSST